MKIMQINVWQGRILTRLLKLIEQENPDILFTQEVFSYPVPVSPSSPWKQFTTLQQIAQTGQFEHHFFSPSTIFPMLGHQLEYGNAIFSRYKLLHATTHYNASSGPQHADDPANVEINDTRNFQHAQIEIDGSTLNLINHHAHWVPHPDGDEISMQRLLKVADYIKNLDGPVLMAGDLNLSPTSPPVVAFQKVVNLQDLVATTSATSTLSAAHYVPENIICDYLLASPGIRISRVEVSNQIVSDHKAVIAEIDYN